MSTEEIIRSGVNVNVTIGIEDLRFILNEAIENTKKELQDIIFTEKAETYPTPKQVSEILGINLSTLWRYGKNGFLKPIEVAGKRRYRMSDVKAFINGGKS